MTETALSPRKMAPSPRTKAERRAESDQKMLAAAVELIAMQGFSATTLEQVGLRAGYSRGLVTQRFGSKEGLIEVLVEQLHQHFNELLDVSGINLLPGLDATIAYLDIYLSNLENSETTMRAYHVLVSESIGVLPGIRATFVASKTRTTQRLRTLIERAQQEGTVRPELDAGAAADMATGLLMGLTLEWLLDPSTDLPRIRKVVLETTRRTLSG